MTYSVSSGTLNSTIPYHTECCVIQSADAWAILGHQKYLTGDMQEAKNCYERTLSFASDASEMHSIYLRLASIYLQEGQVRLLPIY